MAITRRDFIGGLAAIAAAIAGHTAIIPEVALAEKNMPSKAEVRRANKNFGMHDMLGGVVYMSDSNGGLVVVGEVMEIQASAIIEGHMEIDMRMVR
jgi:hypothetical protein